jgi:uncharacterized BrkB/YihY/UPF0761 family membrane protein
MYQYEISIWRFVCGLIWTAGWLGFGHYFAWVRDLQRTHAYIYGILAIFSGIAIWLFPQPIFFVLCAFPAIGGAVVLLCYDYDGRRNHAIKDQADDAMQKVQ